MEMRFPEVEEPDAQAREKGRLLFAGETDFVKGVGAMSGLPPADRMEVCFAGRSNEGKSSLINALTNQKGLARASDTPGRTQEINFFTLAGSHYLVDLPGYGFAKAPKPGQERRIDLPTIGPQTVAGAAKAGLAGLVIEAGGVIVLAREAVIAACDAAGLFLWAREADR